jgi:hypothetical protein
MRRYRERFTVGLGGRCLGCCRWHMVGKMVRGVSSVVWVLLLLGGCSSGGSSSGSSGGSAASGGRGQGGASGSGGLGEGGLATIGGRGGSNGGSAGNTPEACVSTGSMAVPRIHPLPPIVLPSGKVLIAGGIDTAAGHVLASAELYDPTTGAFAPTGSMSTPRLYGWWLPLADNRVLAIGGVDDQNQALSSAEIYDPIAGTWSPTGSMSNPRVMAAGRLLPNGKVLAFGGFIDIASLDHGNASFNSIYPPTTTADLYDPVTSTFTPTGPMAVPHALYARLHALLPNGDVLLGGGYSVSGFTAVVERYSLSAGMFTMVAPLPSGPGEPFLSSLPDGSVLALANGASTPFLFDPTANTFSAGLKDLIGGCSKSVSLADGDVFCAGGDSAHAAATERYHASSNAWTLAAPMIVPRSVPGIVQLPSGLVLVAGGAITGTPTALASAELCSP